LRIDSIDAFPLGVRRRERLLGGTFDYGDYQSVIVRVICDEVIGWGEAMTRFSPKASASLIIDSFAKILDKKTFDSPQEVWNELWATLRVRGHTRGIDVEALSGIDMAMWDVYGKIKREPIARLLSSKNRVSIPAYAGSIFASRGPVDIQIEKAREAELRGVKVKLGFGVDKDLELLRSARKLWRDGMLVGDANGAYGADSALKICRRAGKLELAWFEEPVPADDISGYRKIAAKTGVPIGAGEAWFVGDFDVPLREHLVDIVEPSVSRSGGIGVSWRIATKAKKFGIRYSPMIGMNSALSLAASLQIAAAASNCRETEFDPYGNPLVSELCPGFPRLKKGELEVPKGHGLGVEVDFDFVKKNLLD
jgi:L-alanine-DL-glutamate epimerase-like enolase superfamily enzyme